MTKCLMVSLEGNGLTNGEEGNFAGFLNTTTEATHQWEAIEAGTFTRLAVQIGSGGSGTNTIRFRKNTANGNQVAQRVGSGSAEDTTNSDGVSAVTPDLFNWSYTDTGTDSLADWISILYEAASGVGVYHAVSGGSLVTLSAASTSFHFPLSGVIDSSADPIARAQWRVRGYSQITSIAVSVATNARTTDTVVRLNVNGSPVGTEITYGSGATGRQTVAQNVSLSPGDLVCFEVLTGTGTGNFVLGWINAYCKSSTREFALIGGRNSQTNARAASATVHYFLPGGSNGLDTVESTEQIALRDRQGVAKNAQIYVSANTYSADVHFIFRKNGADTALDVLIPAGQTGYFGDDTHEVFLDATDLFCFSLSGGGSGSLTFHAFSVTIGERVISPDAGQLAVSSAAPTVALPQIIAPAALDLALSSAAPTVFVTERTTIAPASGSLIIGGFAPAASLVSLLAPGAGQLALLASPPTVALTAHVWASPPAAQLSLGGSAPQTFLTSRIEVAPDARELQLTGEQPALFLSERTSIEVPAADLALEMAAPVVPSGRLFAPPAADLRFSGSLPAFWVAPTPPPIVYEPTPDPVFGRLPEREPARRADTVVPFEPAARSQPAEPPARTRF